jgi:hypothetical protein
MKIFSLALMAISAVVYVPSALAADFGVANWGDSFNTVLNSETRIGLTPKTSRHYLIYDAPTMGLSAVRLIYFFENNRLARGAFVFYDPVTKTSQYFSRYEMINESVSKKYGNAQQNDTVYQDNGNDLTMSEALEQNKIMRQSVWQTQTTKIVHQLADDDGEVSHQLVYHSMNVEESAF